MVKEANRNVVAEGSDQGDSNYSKTNSGDKKMTAAEREKMLIENFVGLQHAMTNMSIKFGALSDNISKLLQIFEEAAKNHMSNDSGENKEVLNKLNSLLNQNKTIAQGLILIEGKLRSKSEEPQRAPMPYRPEVPQSGSRPLPRI